MIACPGGCHHGIVEQLSPRSCPPCTEIWLPLAWLLQFSVGNLAPSHDESVEIDHNPGKGRCRVSKSTIVDGGGWECLADENFGIRFY